MRTKVDGTMSRFSWACFNSVYSTCSCRTAWSISEDRLLYLFLPTLLQSSFKCLCVTTCTLFYTHCDARMSRRRQHTFLRSRRTWGTRNKWSEVLYMLKACTERDALLQVMQGSVLQHVERSNLAPQCCVPCVVFLSSIASKLGLARRWPAVKFVSVVPIPLRSALERANRSEQIPSFLISRALLSRQNHFLLPL